MTRLVTLSPSVPASGESLTMKDMVTVGGSIGWAWIGFDHQAPQKVSATVPFTRPAMATMSPASPLDRLALEAAEGEDLRDAAGFDQLAVAVEHLDRLVRLHRAGRRCGR